MTPGGPLPRVAAMDTTPALNQTGAGGSPAALPTTLVTGASSGIGRALALQLAAAGTRVIALARRTDALQALAAQQPGIVPWAADLADTAALPALAARLVAAHPDLAGVIHNAGVQVDARLADAGQGPAQVRQEVDINLVAPIVLTQALLPQLLARRGAFVVNVTSGLAFAPKRSAAVYSATKAGLHLFTRALRVQVQGTGLRVVEAVMPLVDTPMTAGRGRRKLAPDDAARALLDGLRAGRPDLYIGQARAVPWLARWAPGLLARALQRG